MAAMAMAVRIGMIVVAQTLPDHGGTILLGGLGAFALVALLVLYAYHKGQLDQNHNGIPDVIGLEKTKSPTAISAPTGTKEEVGHFLRT